MCQAMNAEKIEENPHKAVTHEAHKAADDLDSTDRESGEEESKPIITTPPKYNAGEIVAAIKDITKPFYAKDGLFIKGSLLKIIKDNNQEVIKKLISEINKINKDYEDRRKTTSPAPRYNIEYYPDEEIVCSHISGTGM